MHLFQTHDFRPAIQESAASSSGVPAQTASRALAEGGPSLDIGEILWPLKELGLSSIALDLRGVGGWQSNVLSKSLLRSAREGGFVVKNIFFFCSDSGEASWSWHCMARKRYWITKRMVRLATTYMQWLGLLANKFSGTLGSRVKFWLCSITTA